MKTSEPLSIFLVDDDLLFTTTLKDRVSKMFKFNTNIQTFSTGEECLKSLEQKPDIILLDYFLNNNFPDAINGSQVLKKVLAKNSETKVIMLSAQDKIEIAVDLIKHGAYDYVIKNDTVFLRTKLAINNATNAISTSNELKNYKLMVRIVLGILIGVGIISIAIQFFFPKLFTKG